MTERASLPHPALLLSVVLLWSWAWWGVSAGLGGTTTLAGALTWLAGGLGPLVGVVVALHVATSGYRRSFARRVFSVRIPVWWWLAALAVGAGPRLVAVGAGAAGGHPMDWERAALASVPAVAGFALVVVLVEEPMWRGVALDAFRSSVARTGLAIGVAWSLWHVPLYVVEGTWHHGLGLGSQDFWAMSVGIVGLSIVLVWLVVRSGGHVLLALVAHAVVNITGELVGGDPTVRTIEAVGIWIAAGVLLSTGRR